MAVAKRWKIPPQFELRAEVTLRDKLAEILFVTDLQVSSAEWILHWGFTGGGGEWRAPPRELPLGDNSKRKGSAIQTPFTTIQKEGDVVSLHARLCIPAPLPKGILFVLARPKDNVWIKDGGSNFYLPLLTKQPTQSPPVIQVQPQLQPSAQLSEIGASQSAEQKTLSGTPKKEQEPVQDEETGEVMFEGRFRMVGDTEPVVLRAKVIRWETEGSDSVQIRVDLATDTTGDLVLHWGVWQRSTKEWLPPPLELCATLPDTVLVEESKAAQSRFITVPDGTLHWTLALQGTKMDLSSSGVCTNIPGGIVFVLWDRDDDVWLKCEAKENGMIPIRTIPTLIPPSLRQRNTPSPRIEGDLAASLVNDIVGREMENNSFTLMHRYKFCYELAQRVANWRKMEEKQDGWTTLYVWLRYSAMRQLVWQRKYHTKPRELSEAQLQLATYIADRYAESSENQWLFRLILATVGRGASSDVGQRIRDEILVLCHRWKEWCHGSFLENWHQKLHNNSTPDDVVICEGFLAFLRSNGDVKVFYSALESKGLTRQRLRSYEQSITSDPHFDFEEADEGVKEELIEDFEDFLSLLKAVHLGTDLSAAIDFVKTDVDPHLKILLDSLLERSPSEREEIKFLHILTEARARLCHHLHARSSGVRDLIFCDLALEAQVRRVIENANLADSVLGSNAATQAALILLVLRNVALTETGDEELDTCVREWQKLAPGLSLRFTSEWFLHAKSVLDRVTRAMHATVDRYLKAFQPKADILGAKIKAERWAVDHFTEEIVRGGHFFALSVMLRRFDPILRKGADLGSWQVVSAGNSSCQGRFLVLETLKECMDMRCQYESVVVAGKIGGDEDVPNWVTGVITLDTVDILSHVAVRARNEKLVFATCYDADLFSYCKSLAGKDMSIVLRSGDLVITPLPTPLPPLPSASLQTELDLDTTSQLSSSSTDKRSHRQREKDEQHRRRDERRKERDKGRGGGDRDKDRDRKHSSSKDRDGKEGKEHYRHHKDKDHIAKVPPPPPPPPQTSSSSPSSQASLSITNIQPDSTGAPTSTPGDRSLSSLNPNASVGSLPSSDSLDRDTPQNDLSLASLSFSSSTTSHGIPPAPAPAPVADDERNTRDELLSASNTGTSDSTVSSLGSETVGSGNGSGSGSAVQSAPLPESILKTESEAPVDADTPSIAPPSNASIAISSKPSVPSPATTPANPVLPTTKSADASRSDGQNQNLGGHGHASSKSKEKRHLIPSTPSPSLTGPYVITASMFNRDCVGGKSCNIAAVQRLLEASLPDWIHAPTSIALPFGTPQRVLIDPVNGAAKIKEEMEKLMSRLREVSPDGAITPDTKRLLSSLRQAILRLDAPPHLVTDLMAALQQSEMGISEEEWAEAWQAIKGVWASKWNERAFASRIKIGFPHDQLYMAVLIQRVIPAKYAFVIHTTNPINNDAEELYGEVVCGLGETLVGSYPGRALAFCCKKVPDALPRVVGFPSKNEALYGEGLIFRSDSNGEDLAGFAGAGLYDSILMKPARSCKPIDYSGEPLVWDNTFRHKVLRRITDVGVALENALATPQDIEGVIEADLTMHVVQTRPQV
mmetsp:Transcript_33167/g.53778  ORF Transcript_33167/g.53778 Transcript_33167/m.53778 type:complete len:1581 (+) Transcript_33167:51-4793(+)